MDRPFHAVHEPSPRRLVFSKKCWFPSRELRVFVALPPAEKHKAADEAHSASFAVFRYAVAVFQFGVVGFGSDG